jgi:MSHA biogenesis protein MshQ
MSITVDYSLPVNCTSKASGNWNVPATWVMCRGGIPLAGDTVTIAAGHMVTQNINTPAIGTLTINGTLNNAANTLDVAGDV